MYAVSHQYKQYNSILVCNGIFQENFLSVLAHKFTNNSAESIAREKKYEENKNQMVPII